MNCVWLRHLEADGQPRAFRYQVRPKNRVNCYTVKEPTAAASMRPTMMGGCYHGSYTKLPKSTTCRLVFEAWCRASFIVLNRAGEDRADASCRDASEAEGLAHFTLERASHECGADCVVWSDPFFEVGRAGTPRKESMRCFLVTLKLQALSESRGLKDQGGLKGGSKLFPGAGLRPWRWSSSMLSARSQTMRKLPQNRLQLSPSVPQSQSPVGRALQGRKRKRKRSRRLP